MLDIKILFQWLSPIGLALTVLGNAEGLLKLSHWADLIVRKWNDTMFTIWSYALTWAPFEVTTIVAQILTVFVLLFIPALMTRLRFGPWTVHTDASATSLTQETRDQGRYVPAILLFAIPAYTYLIAPDVLSWMRGPDCPWEWGRTCINPDFELLGTPWLGVAIFVVVYFAAIVLIIGLGHPKRVFMHLLNGLLIAVIVIALSEVSKLGLTIPNPREIE